MQIDDAVQFIRMEYAEFPELSLTFWQVQRLWHLSHGESAGALEVLMETRFLVRKSDGAYVRRASYRHQRARRPRYESRSMRDSEKRFDEYEGELAALRVENEQLRRSAQSFGALAERLNRALIVVSTSGRPVAEQTEDGLMYSNVCTYDTPSSHPPDTVLPQ